jgi:hypothetical protein
VDKKWIWFAKPENGAFQVDKTGGNIGLHVDKKLKKGSKLAVLRRFWALFGRFLVTIQERFEVLSHEVQSVASPFNRSLNTHT